MNRLSKNIGPFNRFNKSWFAANQRPLLWLLNGPVKPLARWLLRIRPCDVPLREPICQITPNSFSYGMRPVGDRWQITTDFRTHAKYAKRVYFAAKPIWHLIHAWDLGIANPFRPAWNLGFDTLTTYPDPSGVDGADPGEDILSCDGRIDSGSYVSWAAARAGSSLGAQYTQTSVDHRGELYTDTTRWRISRAFTLFETSELPDTCTISGAEYSIYRLYDKVMEETTYPANFTILETSPASDTEIATTDWDAFGSTALASTQTLADFQTNGYFAAALNSSGLSIISKTGITKLGFKPTNDFNNNEPTDDSSAYWYCSDYTGSSYDPKLVVTYTVAAGHPAIKRMGGVPFAAINRGVW